MAGSIRQLLEETLEDLTDVELRRFKANLRDFPVRMGYDNIPRGRLQGADALDLSDLLLSFYAEEYAVQVTAAVLRRSHCNPQAQSLEALAGIENIKMTDVQKVVEKRKVQQGNQPSRLPHQHFVDQFREQLIQRTTTVEQVLDKLYGSILDEEQYQKICSQETNPEKMRQLYKLVVGWDHLCKDQLYNALKTTNPFLIRALGGR